MLVCGEWASHAQQRKDGRERNRLVLAEVVGE